MQVTGGVIGNWRAIQGNAGKGRCLVVDDETGNFGGVESDGDAGTHRPCGGTQDDPVTGGARRRKSGDGGIPRCFGTPDCRVADGGDWGWCDRHPDGRIRI